MSPMHCLRNYMEGFLVCPCNECEIISYYIMLKEHVEYMSNVNQAFLSYV